MSPSTQTKHLRPSSKTSGSVLPNENLKKYNCKCNGEEKRARAYFQ